MNFKRLAILFAVFLFTIIILADLGYLRSLLYFISSVPNLDKVLHFLLIGTLTYLTALGLIETLPERDPDRVLLFSALTLAVIFTLEEISQGPIRGRTSSWKDLAANYVGILFFSYIAWLRVRKRMKNSSDK